ncbi:MAG: penicillin acylase family protein [Chloroflexi bacterium]|nr:penicillin acylase family protein [Chloroflexota bacterium]
MKVVGKILKLLGILLVLVLLAALAGGYLLVQRTFPQTSGTARAPGLKGRAEVHRDTWGVPHIYAENMEDLFFAQGYVHAQDRLWQMEMNRRIGAGRLSEIFGKVTLEQDLFLRTMGFKRVADQEAALADGETRLILDSYAKGVNAFIDTHRDQLPLEFTILGFKPAPWTPADSLVWAKVMAYSLGGNYTSELLRAAIIARLGQKAMEDLEPSYPKEAPLIIPGGTSYQGYDRIDLSALRLMRALVGSVQDGAGSNNWVVDGTRSATGKPLLANDPHLGIQMPSIWYLNHLSGGGFEVIGSSFPGVPGVIIGHNARIAWGVTNVGPDVQDLYIEKMNPQDPKQYDFQGKWEEAQVIKEEIVVKGEKEPRPLQVLVTRHGPIITPVLKGAKDTLALRWTALEPTQVLRSVSLLDRAGNWDEFRRALSYWAVPSQNFVYADLDGNIGYQTPGLIPIRARGHGLVPVPGWSGEYEWLEYIPFDKLPRTYNPPKHFVATANNKVVGDDYPYFISAEWATPFRATRITELLTRKPQLSAQDFQDIQADLTSIPGKELASYLLRLGPQDARQKQALDYLAKWDYRLTRDTVAGAIYEVTLVNAMRNTFADELGEIYKDYEGMALMPLLRLLPQADSPWFDNKSTPQKETRDDILLQSLEQALDYLQGRLGKDVGKWQWGAIHQATFNHQLGAVKPLNLVFNRGPYPQGGDSGTPNNAAFSTADFHQTWVSSYRQIIDLGDLNRSVWMHTSGQSGLPYNKHYGDMIPLWREVRAFPMWFARADVEKNREALLVLVR